MTPSEFWATTPAEIKALADGAEWREQQTRERLAWAVANLVNVHLPRGKQVSPADLLQTPKVERSREEKEADFKLLWEKVESQRRERGGA